MEECYLSVRDVQKRTGLGRSTIYDMMGRGEFPLSYQLTRKKIGWKESEVREWMETRERSPVKFGAKRGIKVVRLPAQEGSERGLAKAAPYATP